MKTNSPNQKAFMFGIICTTFGHDYIITRKVSDHINEYQCSHCGREVTDNMHGTLEELTSRIKRVNTTVATFLAKRSSRLATQNIQKIAS